MITGVRFCLSYDLLNVFFSHSKFVYFHEKLHFCNGRQYDINCSRLKCYVTCGHNTFYDMMLSTDELINSTVILLKIKKKKGRISFFRGS